MTAQISDTVLHQGQRYDLLGNSLCDPRKWGMEPVMLSTACWRGYLCAYAIVEGRLLLQELAIRVADGHYLPVNGVLPEIEGLRAAYRGLGLALPYTGELLLGADSLPEWYEHMGYTMPHRYATVIGLILDDGRLVAVRDRSEEMAALRQRLRNGLGAVDAPKPRHPHADLG
jgi:hypothetical protein